MLNTAIFISGQGSNMERIIKETLFGELKGLINLKLVFSDKKYANGLKTAQKYNIKTLYLKQSIKNRLTGEILLLRELQKEKVEFIILAGYMKILSPFFIEKYKNKIINIHPADTDKYKGRYGYEWTFENKLSYGCITVHLVNENVDSGKVLGKLKFKIPKNSTLEEIKKIGLKNEHEFYYKIIKKYIEELNI